MKESEIKLKKPFQFLKNGSLSTQSPEAIAGFASGINGMLHDLGGEHTFQPPPQELALAMQTNHAIVAQSSEGELAGFVKMAPWVTDASGSPKMAASMSDFDEIQVGGLKPVCIEVGSLVVGQSHQGNNLGKALTDHMVGVAKETYPTLPVIAVVTNDNTPSLHVFNKLGWQIVDQQTAEGLLGIDVLKGWEPPSTIYFYNEQ